MAKTNSKSDPMKTKTGKTRLGPLNVKQLNELIEKETRPKVKAKIQRRIWEITRRPGYKPNVAAAEVTE